MFDKMRSFWLDEPETKLKRRKNKIRKRKRSKNESNVDRFEEESIQSSSSSDAYGIYNPNYDENYEDSYDHCSNYDDQGYNQMHKRRFYEVDIDENEYQYLLENNLIEKEYTEESLKQEFGGYEDQSTKNILYEEEEKERKKEEEKSKNKWLMSDEEFEEFELTEDQKLKCAAFFIWIISLVIFFYFQDYFISPDDKSEKGRQGQSEIDRIKEIGRNRFPPGFLPGRNKYGLPGMGDDDPAEQLSRYFDRNHRGRSHHPHEPKYGRRHDPFGEEEDLDREDPRRKRMRQKKKAQVPRNPKDNVKRILFWTKMPQVYKNKKIFEYYGCEKTNCEFLDDKSRQRECNALVFDYYRINSTNLPANRRKNQLLIFFSEDAPESNENAEQMIENQKLQFNLSWSFTLGSSIQLDTGSLIFDEKLIAIENHKQTKQQIRKKWLSKSKSKDSLIILANTCKTMKLLEQSDLNDLIDLADLDSEHINTTNSTGNRSNDSTANSTSVDEKQQQDLTRAKQDKAKLILNLNRLNKKLNFKSILTNYEQYLINEFIKIKSNKSELGFDLLMNCSLTTNELKDLIKNYKFLFIIESQSCKNYRNNLVYSSLEMDTIPILNDYNNEYDLPFNSIIKLNEFDNLNLLADYLQELKSKFSKFFVHFSWKNYFKVTYKKRDICNLCDKLNKINSKNIDKYMSNVNLINWKLDSKCFTFDHHLSRTSVAHKLD